MSFSSAHLALYSAVYNEISQLIRKSDILYNMVLIRWNLTEGDMVFGIRALRRIFEPNKEEVRGREENLCNVFLRNFQSFVKLRRSAHKY